MNNSEAKTALLDTNALLNMFGFWETCHWGSLDMQSINDRAQLREELKTNKIPWNEQFTKDHFKSIEQGLKCFKALANATDRYQYRSSLVCRSEMHRVILSAHAHAGLNRNRVPLSLQKSRPLVLHQAILTDADYQRIDGEINQFFETLKETHDINIINVENEGIQTEEIFQVAQGIWSNILIETMDAYIYAAAICARADCFITSDDALKSTANKLREAKETNWKEIKDKLTTMLQRPGEKLPINFPIGCKVPIKNLP